MIGANGGFESRTLHGDFPEPRFNSRRKIGEIDLVIQMMNESELRLPHLAIELFSIQLEHSHTKGYDPEEMLRKLAKYFSSLGIVQPIKEEYVPAFNTVLCHRFGGDFSLVVGDKKPFIGLLPENYGFAPCLQVGAYRAFRNTPLVVIVKKNDQVLEGGLTDSSANYRLVFTNYDFLDGWKEGMGGEPNKPMNVLTLVERLQERAPRHLTPWDLLHDLRKSLRNSVETYRQLGDQRRSDLRRQ